MYFVGWQGPDCTLDVDECDYASPCGSHGNCTNLNGSYECACEPEYTGIMLFVWKVFQNCFWFQNKSRYLVHDYMVQTRLLYIMLHVLPYFEKVCLLPEN